MKATNIKIEYLTSPLGIDITSPHITWNCNEGIKQSAFQINAYKNGILIYDSKKVKTNKMDFVFPIVFSSRERIDFDIVLWNEKDEKGEKSSSFFEIGLLKDEDWKAKWITGNYNPHKKKIYPVDCFLKEFKSKDVIKARLYISACGIYEAKINNKRVGDFIFAPGFTDNRKRIQYQSYDVTSLLKDGENEIEVLLADGYYRGGSGAKGRRNTYGKEIKFIAQLELIHKDGTENRIITDSSWKWSNDGPILFADLKDGEKIDANKVVSYSSFAKAISYKSNLTASNNVFIKEHEIFKPLNVFKSKTGKTIIDFGQNISGYISFSVNAKKYNSLHVRLGEILDENNNVTLRNIQCTYKGKKTPLQEIHHICKEGYNTYKTKFFYGGFRYAEIDADFDFEPNAFSAIAIYSDFEMTSSFECSSPLLSQFYKNTIWSLKSNSDDVPTDCPTRERMGWTGDSEIFFNTASYLSDYASFSRKHVKDIFDRQWKSGRLPQIAPFANEDWFMWTMNGSVGWACAGVYIPLYFYKRYGDKRILEENFQGIIKYAEFMIKRAGKWGGIYAKHVKISHKNKKYFVNAGQSYGEWAEPNDVCAFKWTDFAQPHPEESTAYTYFTLKRVLEIYDILNKPHDKTYLKIKEYSDGAKIAYQEFVTTKGNTLDTDRQAKLVRPLYMNLLTKEQEKYAKERLIKALDNYSWRLGTGFLSTPLILDVLEDIDLDYAYRLLLNEEMPGWLYMPKVGATTIWEAWEGDSNSTKEIASLNHYSKGAVIEWVFREMLGIHIDDTNIIIAPKANKRLSYAKGSYLSRFGEIKSEWQIENNIITYKITIPANVEAKFIFNNKEEILGPGQYEFKEELKKDKL